MVNRSESVIAAEGYDSAAAHIVTPPPGMTRVDLEIWGGGGGDGMVRITFH